MIYKLKLLTNKKKGTFEKVLLLSADSKSQVIRRAVSQYRVDAHDVEILEEIDEANVDINKKNGPIKREQPKKEYSQELREQVDELIAKAYYVGGKDHERLLRDYIQIETQVNVDIRDQMLEVCSRNYKKVRLYLEKDGKKGCYKYMILVKENKK